MATLSARLMQLERAKARELKGIDRRLKRNEDERHSLKRKRNDVEEKYRQRAMKLR